MRSGIAVVQDPKTEIALSDIGGSIAYDWTVAPAADFVTLSLHGFLGRYERNYAIFTAVLLPWGILVNILNLTARERTGRLRFCRKWWFAEPDRTYGLYAPVARAYFEVRPATRGAAGSAAGSAAAAPPGATSDTVVALPFLSLSGRVTI